MKYLIFKGSTDILYIHYLFNSEEDAHRYMRYYWKGHLYNLKEVKEFVNYESNYRN